MDCTHSHTGGNRRAPRYTTLPNPSERADASPFVLPFHVEPGQRFLLLCRVSSTDQGRRDNLRAQRLFLTRAVEESGGIVCAGLEFEWSGRGPQWHRKLAMAARFARRLGATLLADTVDRLVRSQRFRSDDPVLCKEQAQRQDLLDLEGALHGVKVMTFLDPNASAEECRSLLIRWGQSSKGHTGGRPQRPQPGHRQRRRDLYLQRVLRMHGWGLSCRRITRYLRREEGVVLTPKTVWQWVQEAAREPKG
jgi:hypothetical protein